MAQIELSVDLGSKFITIYQKGIGLVLREPSVALVGRHGDKLELLETGYRAESIISSSLGGAQVVVFGHTHKYFEKMIDGRLWLNPGSCGRRRFDQEITMAVMTVDNGRYEVKKIVISDEKQK